MKLYIALGRYVGTQLAAKALDKGFKQVEVDTDKEGLIRYLNHIAPPYEDEYTTVVERQDPPMDEQPPAAVQIDEVWERLPLAQKLHFAALAMEDARTAIRPNLLD